MGRIRKSRPYNWRRLWGIACVIMSVTVGYDGQFTVLCGKNCWMMHSSRGFWHHAHGQYPRQGSDPRTSKPSSPFEEPNSRILRGYVRAKEFGNPDPFHIKPKAHAEEEEMFEDEWRRSKLPGDVIEDNPVLGKSRPRKGKVTRHQRQSPRASQGKA